VNVNLEELAFSIHSNAHDKGFWEPMARMDEQDYVIFYLKQIAMIHSEASEVLEAIRKDKGESVIVEEMADIIIRILDLWAGMNREGQVKTLLTDALMSKTDYNRSRPRLHGVLA
jgi:hypothetical protein